MKEDRDPLREAGWISLGEDEELIRWGHPSIFPYLPTFLMFGAIAIAGLVTPFVFDFPYATHAGIAVFFVGLGMVIYEYIRYISVFYVFTDERFIKNVGFIDHNPRKIPYEKKDKIDPYYPLLGRIFSYGHLEVYTASHSGEDSGKIEMRYVPELGDILSEVQDYSSTRNN